MTRPADADVQEIRAAVLRRRGGPMKAESLTMEGPRDDEVLVRIIASGICHTDIRYVDDWYEESDWAVILGHEGAGVVERVGAHPIIGVDRIPSRLKLALELGATHVIDTRHESVTDGIRAATGNGVDSVIESTGSDRLYRLAVVLLNPKGIAAYLAGENGPDSLPGGRRALSIVQGDAVPQEFIPKLIDFYGKGLFPFDRLEKFYEFGQINRAIADARCGHAIKPVLRISEA